MNHIFIGFDQRQPVAFHVAMQSIMMHASVPVAITPLILGTLPINLQGLTPFTYSRFLVPWLCDYIGRALYIDCDVLVRGDVRELFELPEEHAVHVVHHNGPLAFERASVMLFDCELCGTLDPDYVQRGKGLFDLSWAPSLGVIPPEWNHLVGYQQPRPGAKLAHFTQGLPCYEVTHKDEHGSEWRGVAVEVLSVAPWEVLMGGSVHAEHVKQRCNSEVH